MDNQLIDVDLIKSCQRNEKDAQRQMYQALSPKMFGICLRYACDRAEAEDYLHDGFIHLFRKIGDYRHEGSFEGWARRIFVTISLGNIRKKRRQLSVTDEQISETIPTELPNVLSTMQSEEIVMYIEKLPPTYKMVLNLYSIEGYSHQEIALELGITAENSRIQLLRAKSKLAKYLQEAGLIE